MKKYKLNEAELVASCRFTPHYSGEDSHAFWQAVNDKANDRVLYDFACALQDVEARVLAALNPGVERRVRALVRSRRRKR